MDGTIKELRDVLSSMNHIEAVSLLDQAVSWRKEKGRSTKHLQPDYLHHHDSISMYSFCNLIQNNNKNIEKQPFHCHHCHRHDHHPHHHHYHHPHHDHPHHPHIIGSPITA